MVGPSITVDTDVSTKWYSTKQPTQGRLQMRWEERMGFPSRAIRHTKTSVLLLSWDPGHDDLGVGKEVRKLHSVFEEDYGFKVYNKQVNIQRRPQHQALVHLSTFVDQEDDEQGLLIIYYAGHGYSDVDVKSGDMMLAGNLRPPNSEEAKHVQEKVLKRNSIAWSEVESAIRSTDADVLLIFDCCNAGRLCRPYRNLPRSYFEFLGACSENQTTMGPGPESFTRALTWALQELAKKPEPFSTSQLLHTIMRYKKFPRDQIPVLSDRHMPGEHIVISRKDLSLQATNAAPSKCERAKELQNREYIDLRFHFDHKIDDHHFDATADALSTLTRSNKANWARVAFLEQNSLMEKTAMKWKELTWSGKKSMSISSVPTPNFLDTQVASPDVDRSLNPRISTLSYTPVTSGRASRASSVGTAWERTALIPAIPKAQRMTASEDSILFHLKAIGSKSTAIFPATLGWLTNKMLCRDEDEETNSE